MTNSFTTKKVVALGLGLALAFSAVFVSTANANTDDDLQAQISNLLAMIATLQAQLAGSTTGGGTTGGSTAAAMQFTLTHSVGDRGGEVMDIQKFLNINGFTVSTSGAGSAGMETSFFGPATKAAVINFQNAYASEILAPVGLSAGTGYWGSSSRAKANAMEIARASAGGGGGDTTPVAGTNDLTVSAAAQPGNSLAPALAANVPFTKFTLTAGSSDVTVDSVVVELTGLAERSSFDKLVMLDEAGMRVGDEESIKSDDRATFNKAFVVKAGTSMTYTVAANMDTLVIVSANAGEVAAFTVVAINTDATVVGSLPITGAQHTINGTLTVGTLVVSASSVGTSANVNDTDIKIAKAEFAASGEDVLVKKVRLYQDGNADLSDVLDNVTAKFAGSNYDVVIDGDYLVIDFGSGVLIESGDSETVEIRADIIAGTNDTIQIDFKDDTDVTAMGDDYGYGAGVTTATPVTISTILISGGAVSIQDDSDFDNNQKVAAGTSKALLAMFEVEVDGEDVTADTSVDITPSAMGASVVGEIELTNVAIYRDGSMISDTEDFTFTSLTGVINVVFDDVPYAHTGDAVKYEIRGNVDKDVANGGVYTVGAVTLSNMETVSGESIAGSPSDNLAHATEINGTVLTMSLSNPDETNVNADENGVIIAEVTFDAEDSGDDVRVTEVALTHAGTTITAAKSVDDCRLYDGSSTVSVDKEDFTTGSKSTWSTDFVVTKGTEKVILVKCDLGTFVNAETVGFAFGAANSVEFDAEGQETSTNISGQDGTGAAAVAVSSGIAVIDETSEDVNDDKAVRDNANSVVLAQIELEAKDAELELDGVTVAVTGFALIDGKVDLYIDGVKIDGETAVASTVFTSLNHTIAKDTTAIIEFRADMDAAGAVVITGVGTWVWQDAPATVTDNVTPANLPAVTVLAALPVVIAQEAGTVTVTTSYESDRKIIEYSVKADGGDVVVADTTLLAVYNTGMTLPNAEVKVYSDAAHTNEQTAVTGTFVSGTPLAFATAVTISEGDTYYFVLEADVQAPSGSSATVTLQDLAAAFTFTGGPAAQLVIEEEIKATVNTTL